MKEIVPESLLKDYLTRKAVTHDDFLALRRVLSYQYGSMLCLHHTLSIDTALPNFMLNLQTGNITIYALPFNSDPEKPSCFSIRLSTNFHYLFKNTYINAGVLPALIATADALSNSKYPPFYLDSTSKDTWNCSTANWANCEAWSNATWPNDSKTSQATTTRLSNCCKSTAKSENRTTCPIASNTGSDTHSLSSYSSNPIV
jgi:hypothetical protein